MIPEMTDSLGKYWDQPSRDRIIVDNTHAVMSPDTFDALADYSCSNPSGVYDGKMWKRGLKSGKWYLVWYGPCDNPNLCKIETREILVIE